MSKSMADHCAEEKENKAIGKLVIIDVYNAILLYWHQERWNRQWHKQPQRSEKKWIINFSILLIDNGHRHACFNVWIVRDG